MSDSTLVGNGSASGKQAHRAGGSLSITRTSLDDEYHLPGGLVGVTPTTPLPDWRPNFTMVVNGANLVPTYQYDRSRAAFRASQLSRQNFPGFPQGSDVSSVVGYVDGVTTRLRRDYFSYLEHVTGQSTGSSIFVSEVLHYGGIPMTIDPGDNPVTPQCQNITGGYTQRGWHPCPTERNASQNWKDHQGIVQYFTSLPGGGLIGSVIRAEIEGVIWRDGSPGFPLAGTLKTDLDLRNAMINRFAPGGDLASVARGDYIFIIVPEGSHGFIILGWGPVLGTIEGIDYAYNNTLGATRSDANPIPYVADFCFGTDGTPGTADGTGWLQDPRPRPFYTTITQVFQGWLRPDQVSYLRRRPHPNLSVQPIAIFDNFSTVNWQFYKIPDAISLSTLPINRLYFSG